MNIVFRQIHIQTCLDDCEKYGSPGFDTGDIVSIICDFVTGTIEFVVNKRIGVAFKDLYGTVTPCVCLCGEGASIEIVE